MIGLARLRGTCNRNSGNRERPGSKSSAQWADFVLVSGDGEVEKIVVVATEATLDVHHGLLVLPVEGGEERRESQRGNLGTLVSPQGLPKPSL